MEHVAILSKSSGMLEKILSGEKIIESRWYTARFSPWDRISVGDIVYFKYAGMPVQAKAEVKAVEQYAELTPKKVKDLWTRYAKQIGIVQKEEVDEDDYAKNVQLKNRLASTLNKKYCILVHLGNICSINKTFRIDKRGFGRATAWLTIDDVNRIRRDLDTCSDDDNKKNNRLQKNQYR